MVGAGHWWFRKASLENLIPPINARKTLNKITYYIYVYDNIWTYTIIHTVLLTLSRMLLCDMFVFTPWRLNLDWGGTIFQLWSIFVQPLSQIYHLPSPGLSINILAVITHELHTITDRGRPPEYRTYMEANSKLAILLKWQCHEIFDFRFFKWIYRRIVHTRGAPWLADISENFQKIQSDLYVNFRDLGENDSWKNMKQKFLWRFPYNAYNMFQTYFVKYA
jgi:hypothetical protein